MKLLKKNKILEIFNTTNNKKLSQFYEAFLVQIKQIEDFQYLFKLFPDWSINRAFIILINKKLNNLINSNFNDEEKNRINSNILYDIFQKIIIFNSRNGFDIIPLLTLIELNYSTDFISNFYIYLIKNKNLKNLIQKIKKKILDYFIEQQRNKFQPETLIYLSLISPDGSFLNDLFNQMDNFIINEDDFYQKEENSKFILYKLFYEKKSEIIKKNEKLLEGKYVIETMKLTTKIDNDLNSGNINYELIDNLIDEDNSLYNKILIINNYNKENADKLYNKIKTYLKICKYKFNIFEKIIEFYQTFYKETKRGLYTEIKLKIKNYKEKNIIDIINLDIKEFIKIENFNLDEAIKESENLKYKSSSFFMIIYREIFNKEQFEKTEDEIFKNSIEVFRQILTRIVEQNKTGENFFKINYIDKILECVRNKSDNMKEEIEFLCKEFPKLNEENNNYIKNNLLNDLINYSYRDKICFFLKGVIYFLETFTKIKEIQLTDLHNFFVKSHKIISSNTVKANDIKQIIEILIKWDYNIKSEKTPLMDFYELLLEKGDSIIFIKKIKDTNLDIRNLNEFIDEQENSQLQTSDLIIYWIFIHFLILL